MKPSPFEKPLFDVVVDFIWGALGGVLLSWYMTRFPGRYPLWRLHFSSVGWCLYLAGGSMICGALNSLYRDRMQEPSLLPNVIHDPSKRGRFYLWILFAAGCCLIAWAFLRFGQN